MSRHFEKTIAAAQAVVAEVGQPRESTDPMTHAEIESFVKGFGLSTAATNQIVRRWIWDAQRSRNAGYDAGYDAAVEDN